MGSHVYFMMDMIALNTDEMITPDSTSINMELLPRMRANDTVIITEAMPNISAVICTVNMPPSARSANTAPTEAPAVTPSVSGVARGLANKL